MNDGSYINVLFKHAFNATRLSLEDIHPYTVSIYGFIRESVIPMRIIHAALTVGIEPRAVTRNMDFSMIDNLSAYIVILGWPALAAVRASMID